MSRVTSTRWSPRKELGPRVTIAGHDMGGLIAYAYAAHSAISRSR
jgi:pimeloyl-ACP methyl ester carboxylesterase